MVFFDNLQIVNIYRLAITNCLTIMEIVANSTNVRGTDVPRR